MIETEWPDAVVKAARNRTLVLFVGAGVSASCRNDQGKTPPTWPQLLCSLADSVQLREADRRAFEELVEARQLLDAAELLKFTAKQTGRIADFTRKLTEEVQGNNRHPFHSSEWHSAIASIDPAVIVTTNYDKIMENAPELNYMVTTYASPDVDSHVRLAEPVIIKLHGSVDEPSGTILTRSDYTYLHSKGSLALSLVQALAMTRTLLFVGYSLSDPDLQVLLQNVFAGRHDYNVSPHYILMSDTSPDHKKEVFLRCYGTNAIIYDNSTSDHGLSVLQKLGNLLSSGPPLISEL